MLPLLVLLELCRAENGQTATTGMRPVADFVD